MLTWKRDKDWGLYIFKFDMERHEIEPWLWYDITSYLYAGIYDFNGDGYLELAGLKSTGSKSWLENGFITIKQFDKGWVPEPVTYMGGVYVIDVDGDGTREVVDVNMIMHLQEYRTIVIDIYNVTRDGSLVFYEQQSLYGDFYWSVGTTGEFDDIPGEEFVCAGYHDQVAIFGLKNGIFSLKYNGSIPPNHCGVLIDDVDNDGQNEVVFAMCNRIERPSIRTLECVNGTIVEGIRSPYIRAHFTQIDVGDVDGDGKKEIIGMPRAQDYIAVLSKQKPSALTILITPDSKEDYFLWVIIIILILFSISLILNLRKLTKYNKGKR